MRQYVITKDRTPGSDIMYVRMLKVILDLFIIAIHRSNVLTILKHVEELWT